MRVISIWFFIGVFLTICGVLILATGLYELRFPNPHPVVLAELHAPIWWGTLLLLLGSFYVVSFRPGR